MRACSVATALILCLTIAAGGCGFSKAVPDFTVVEAGDGDGPAKVIRSSPDDAEMVLVEEGYFTCGSYGKGEGVERPARIIWLPSFYIDKYEVSCAQYTKFLEYIEQNGDSSVRSPDAPDAHDYFPRYWDDASLNQPNLPVVGVDFYMVYAYAKWAGKRLPTEIEWEKAARGPSKEDDDPRQGRLYPWGDEAPDEGGVYRVNYAKNGNKKPGMDLDGYKRLAPVDSFPNGVSPYGVFNMGGNVFEWTATFWDPLYYERMPKRNPRGPGNGEYRTVRGGAWKWRDYHIRCAFRKKLQHKDRKSDLGFRLAADVP